MAKPAEPTPTIMNGRLTWRNFGFWRNVYLYFWLFALAGHLLEFFILQLIVPGYDLGPDAIPTVTPLAAPYGLGAAAFILVIWPLFKRFKKPKTVKNIVLTFLLAALLGGIVEYICAAVVVAIDGVNIYWNYSNSPLNLNGYISLGSVSLFGALGTLFFYFIFPAIEDLFERAPIKLLNLIFFVLFGTYVADLIALFIKAM